MKQKFKNQYYYEKKIIFISETFKVTSYSELVL